MRITILLAAVALAFSCSGSPNTNNGINKTTTNTPAKPGPAPVYTYEVVNTYPHDPKAFTEGLFFKDGFLYESTGQEKASSLRKVELETGKVVQKWDMPPEDFGDTTKDPLMIQHVNGNHFIPYVPGLVSAEDVVMGADSKRYVDKSKRDDDEIARIFFHPKPEGSEKEEPPKKKAKPDPEKK